jgi:hypothetical protein
MVAVAAVGCKKVEKILPKKDGTWKATSITYYEYENSSLDTTYTETNNPEIYTFEKDGTGTISDGTDTANTTWEVNDDNDVIKLCAAFPGSSIYFCTDYDILESDKDRQVWRGSDKETGDTFWTETEATLERVD